MKRTVSALLCVFFLITLTALPASANSAQTRWDGVSSTGAIISDGDCPIVVEHELLTFDLQEFPKSYYQGPADFLAYTGSVTAEYTFYNPSDYTVTAALLFPFGHEPDYAGNSSGDVSGADTGKFGVSINGGYIEADLRHSWSPYSDQFELEKDLALLHDGFMEDEFYDPDLAVTKYTFSAGGVDTKTYSAANAAFDMDRNDSERRIYFVQQNGGHTQDDGDFRVETWVKNGEVFTVYVIGEDYDTFPEWTFYQNGGSEDGEEIDGTMTLTGKESLTFRELAMSEWNEKSGVSEIDWYNAVVAMLEQSEQWNGSNLYLDYTYSLDLTSYLMRWYEYEITLEPGERITNAVTAPMYPDINGQYEPPIYTYTYLLSPAQTWVEFGTLEIVVNTPYYMTECEMGEFIKTDTGYTLTLDGLPEGELEFILCSKEKPKKDVNYGYLKFYLIPIGIVILIVVAGVVAIWKRVRKRK